MKIRTAPTQTHDQEVADAVLSEYFRDREISEKYEALTNLLDPEEMLSRVGYVGVDTFDLDSECWTDIAEGRGIRIKSVESFDKKHQKIYDGLQSEFFGTDFSSDAAFKERYSCKCGRFTGKALKGFFCKECQSYVEYHDIDLTKFGWIILDKFMVLSPIYGAKLAEALGKVDGEYILKLIIGRKYDEEGQPDFSDKEQALLANHPFIQKGMIWLHDNLEEVLLYYRRKKPSKKDLFDELLAHQVIMWTHCIPVFTSLLRTEMPSEKGSRNFKIKVNTHYKSIVKLVNAINAIEEDDMDFSTMNSIDIFLAGIQREISEVFEVTYADLTTKRGILVSRVLGGRYNFSARNIIVPDSGYLRSDEVLLGYIPFLELFRYELQNEYRKIHGCTPYEANSAWKRATNRFDPKYYAIIEHMINNPEYQKYLCVLINRNPSINYGSFDFVRVKGVKKDINDKTLTIPTHIISSMNADGFRNISGKSA